MARTRSRTVAGLAAVTLAVTGATALATTAGADTPGIHVADGRIVEADGTDLLLRGVNHPHAWYTHQTGAYADIASVGANSVRVVLASGDRWPRTDAAQVADIVDRCTASRLICMLEVHDTTGYGEPEHAPGAASLDQAVDYWEYLHPVLSGTEDRVLINIGNEPYGNDQQVNAGWATDTSAAIERMRAIGYDHALVVDAPNWGQDWQRIMFDQAPAVAAADPHGNTIFSIHMYGVYSQAATVTEYLEHMVGLGLPVIVGEFGWDHSDGSVALDAILSETRRLGLGWLAWSWSGNSGGVEYLDLVENFDVTTPSPWGERIFTGPDGFTETSVEASVFGSGGGPTPTPTPTPTPSEDPEPTPSPTPSDDPLPEGCTATFALVGSWPGGYQGEVTVTADDDATVWSTAFVLLDGSVDQLWGGTLVDSSPPRYVVSNAPWNGTLSAGRSTTYGFIGSGPAPSGTLDVLCEAS